MRFPPGSIKLEHGHDNTDLDYHETLFMGETVMLDRLGRANNNGTRTWLVAICNNSDCAARVLVRDDILTSYIEEVLCG